MITRRLRGNTFMPSFRTAHRSLIYARRICAGRSRMAVTVTITPRGLIRAYAHGIARRMNLFGFQLAAIGFASTSVIRIRKEEIAAHVARSRQKEKNMMFRSNCVRPFMPFTARMRAITLWPLPTSMTEPYKHSKINAVPRI